MNIKFGQAMNKSKNTCEIQNFFDKFAVPTVIHYFLKILKLQSDQ